MSARDEELAQEWFDKDEHDWVVVDTLLAAGAPALDMVCFYCHQTAEKYLKGFLTWHAQPFSYTHNLQDLLRDCAGIDGRLTALRGAANALNVYAVDTRYRRMPHSDPTLQEARAAREAGREIRPAARQSLRLPVT